jgi:Ser-tRNA(Ala) deacylase AlaX
MTEALYRGDAYLRECTARVVSAGPEGIVLDRSVFYPLGGGQAGDAGTLTRDDGLVLRIADTRKSRAPDASPDDALHLPAAEDAQAAARLRPGEDAHLDARLEALRHLERVRAGVLAAVTALWARQQGLPLLGAGLGGVALEVIEDGREAG